MGKFKVGDEVIILPHKWGQEFNGKRLKCGQHGVEFKSGRIEAVNPDGTYRVHEYDWPEGLLEGRHSAQITEVCHHEYRLLTNSKDSIANALQGFYYATFYCVKCLDIQYREVKYRKEDDE